MGWQIAVTWLMVAAACVYIAQRFVRAVSSARSGCNGGCGCAKPTARTNEPALIAPESLTIRRS